MTDEESRKAVGSEIAPDLNLLRNAEQYEGSLRIQCREIAFVLEQQIIIADRRAKLSTVISEEGLHFIDPEATRREAQLIRTFVDQFLELTAPDRYPDNEEC